MRRYRVQPNAKGDFMVVDTKRVISVAYAATESEAESLMLEREVVDLMHRRKGATRAEIKGELGTIHLDTVIDRVIEKHHATCRHERGRGEVFRT